MARNALAEQPVANISKYVVTLSAGPAWENAGKTQTFFLQPMTEKAYIADNKTNLLANGELFAGIQRSLNANLDGQFGIEVATTGNSNISGDIWDDALPQFNNFNYAYKVKQTRISVKGKFIKDLGYTCKPYVSGSLGIGFNKAGNFTSTPTIFEAIPTPGFQSNTVKAFTYTLGIGVQKVITPHWHGGIGYEFSDWGQSRLDRAPTQTLSQGLSLAHLYTNGLQFNLSYLA